MARGCKIMGPVKTLFLAVLIIIGCSKEVTVDIRVLIPDGQNPFSGVTTLKLKLLTASPREYIIATDGAGNFDFTIKDVPTGEYAEMVLSGYDSQNKLISLGHTPSVPLTSALYGYIQIFFCRVEQFARIPGVMTTARSRMAVHRFSDLLLLISGGKDSAGQPLSSAEVYNPFSLGFEPTTSPMLIPRAGHVALPVSTGDVFIHGGLTSGGSGLVEVSSAERFSAASWTFTTENGAGEGRAATVTAVMPGDTLRYLLLGGEQANGTALSSVMQYNPDTFTLTGFTPALPSPRSAFTATPVTTLGTEQLLIFGGATSTESTALLLATAGSGSVSELANAPAPRRGHGAVKLSDGKVLLFGGRDALGNPLDEIILYDPACNPGSGGCTGFTTLATKLASPRYGHRVFPLPANKLLVAGGRTVNGNVLGNGEIFTYDQGAGTLTAESQPAMTTGRADFAAHKLPTGAIIFIGGVDNGGNPLNSAELFTPQE